MSVVLKYFERLVLRTITGPLLDPPQFVHVVPAFTGQWIRNILTDRRQKMRLEKITSHIHIISTGTPQGCVLSPLLFSFYTNNGTSSDQFVKPHKSIDNTTVSGVIFL